MTEFTGHPLFDTADHLPHQIDSLVGYPSLSGFLSAFGDNVSADWRQSALFLKRHTSAPGSYARFRGEVQRFLNWLWVIQTKTLVSVNEDDLDEYLAFVKRPPASWVTLDRGTGKKPEKGSGRQRSFHSADGGRVANPYWRPFVGSGIRRKKASLESCVAILSIYFKKLVSAGYLDRSPVTEMSRNSKKAETGGKAGAKGKIKTVQRAPRLTKWQWIYLHDTLVDAANKDDRYERHLFTVVTMKTLYLRVFELAPHGEKLADNEYAHEPIMGDFSQTTVENDRYWHVYIHGKGDEPRHIPVPNAYLPYLKRYRAYRGLPPIPTPDEPEPLLTRHDRKTPLYSKRSVERLVEASMELAIAKLKAEGKPDAAAEFEQFKRVTHILRHTGASIDLEDGRPLRDVSEDLGHASPAFTEQIYIDPDAARRYTTGQKRLVV